MTTEEDTVGVSRSCAMATARLVLAAAYMTMAIGLNLRFWTRIMGDIGDE